MSVDLAKSDRNALDAEEAKALASEIIACTSPDEAFDAGLILENHPGLAEHRSVVVDLAYEEFCRRVEAGEAADPKEFARRFPGVAQSLLKVLEVHEYLEQHPNAFVKKPSPGWPEAGEQISGFTLVREIGRGGFSRVFLAREKGLGDRDVVVKICKQANHEAAWLGRLEHPHVVPVHSVKLLPRRGFTVICMPHLGSATLADVIKEVFEPENPSQRGAAVLKAIERANQRHGLPRNEREVDFAKLHWTLRRGSYAEAIVEIGAQICGALAYAHGKGIHHCDVKPSNVLLTTAGRSLLLDFNLSMQHGGSGAIVGGTLPYMAPEQLQFLLAAKGEHLPQIDARSDLFAFGVTMFQTLTGRLPFSAGDPSDAREESARRLLDQQRQGRNLRGELERVVSPAVARVISQCLAFDPDDRPASAEDVARRLRDDLRVVPRARRWAWSHRLAVTVAALAFVLGAASVNAGLARRHFFYCRQGIERFEAGDFSAAIGWLDWAISARGDYWEAYVLRGDAKLRASQGEGLDPSARSQWLTDASNDLDKPQGQTLDAEWKPRLADCLTELGNLCYQTGMDCLDAGECSAAGQWFERAIGARSGFVQAVLFRGWADLKESQRADLDDAVRSRLLRSAWESLQESWKQTESAESAASLAYCCAEMGNRDEAAAFFDSAAKRGLKTPAVLNNLGYSLSKQRKFEEATARLRDAIRLEPKLQAAHHNLAEAEWKLALEEFTKAKASRSLPSKDAAARQEAKDAAARHEARGMELYRSAFKHIDTARRTGPRSTDLAFLAARIYADASAAFQKNPDPAVKAQGNELLEQAWKSCQAALELSLDPHTLQQEVATYAPKLAQDPRFRQLLTTSPGAAAPVPAALLVDVYPDVRERLKSTADGQSGLRPLQPWRSHGIR